jgi:hypothetical protein
MKFFKGMSGPERLMLVAANLFDPNPFEGHIDVDAVLHMASPYLMDVKTRSVTLSIRRSTAHFPCSAPLSRANASSGSWSLHRWRL